MLRERQEIVREKEIEDTRWREKELDSGADRTKEVKCQKLRYIEDMKGSRKRKKESVQTERTRESEKEKQKI